MKTAFPLAGAALLLVLSILGSCRNQAIAQSPDASSECAPGRAVVSQFELPLDVANEVLAAIRDVAAEQF